MSAFLIGIALGVFFFGGLYFSVKKIASVKYPRLLMLGSSFLRMAVLLLVFFYISKGGYQHILLALLGLIIVRLVITQMIKADKTSKAEGEVTK